VNTFLHLKSGLDNGYAYKAIIKVETSIPTTVVKMVTTYALIMVPLDCTIYLYASRVNCFGIRVYPFSSMELSLDNDMLTVKSNGNMQKADNNIKIKLSIKFEKPFDFIVSSPFKTKNYCCLFF